MPDLSTALTPPFSYGQPTAVGALRKQPSDFKVQEQLLLRPDGKQAHRWFYIEKTNTNTQWLCKQIARACGIKNRDVGYAGLKDRNAVTRQWLSVSIEHADAATECLHEIENVDVIETAWHGKKLRPGTPLENHFEITLRDASYEARDIQERVSKIQQHGCPNYYGPQRFGHDGGNIETAIQSQGRQPKGGIGLSALRSYLFNVLLAQRVQENTWAKKTPGDVFAIHGSNSVFVDDGDTNLQDRLDSLELHIAATLYGQGTRLSAGHAAQIEDQIWATQPDVTEVLDQHRLTLAHRPLRLMPCGLQCSMEQNILIFGFRLPAGAYATTVLRELVDVA